MNWEQLVDAVVDGRFRLRTLTYAGKGQAEFAALCAGPEGGAATVTLLALEPDENDQVEAEMARAAELQHPHLLRILGMGKWRSAEAQLLYLASEAPEETLADKLKSGPLAEAAAERVLSHVVAGLEFLHGRGLVYRNVTPQTVVRIGPAWKLADYGGMVGDGTHPADLPAFLNGSQYTPPEAYDGQVLRAWDVWSFGVLMTELLTGSTSPFLLPVRFEEIRRRCLEREPGARAAVGEIASMLPRPSVKAAPPAKATPPAVSVPKPPQVEQAEPAPKRFSAGAPALEPPEAKNARATEPRAVQPQAGNQFAAAKKFLWIPALAALVLAFMWGRREAAPPAPAPQPPSETRPIAGIRDSAVSDRPSPMPRPGDERRREAARAAAAARTTAPVQPAQQAPAQQTQSQPQAEKAQRVQPQQEQKPEHGSDKVVTGRADFAGDDMNGRRTASGERFSNNALTAAAKAYPLGTRLRVTNVKNNRSTIVKVNDRGSFRRGYVIRLTRRAAKELDFARTGSTEVRLEVVSGG